MILRAKLVLPICRAPVSDGVLLTVGRRIDYVKTWRDLTPAQQRAAVDLGQVLLLPGLINAHCHLDYTHMAGQIPPPKQFTEWLKVMVSIKAGWSLEDYAESWQAGARMLLHSGTTTVADIEAVPALLPEAWKRTPLKVFSFLEMITLGRQAPQVVLREALDKTRSLPGGRTRSGLSPHAPYTTVLELLRRTAELARKQRLLVSTHLAESAAESAMFIKAKGDLFEWLQRSGRDMSDCGAGSPVRHCANAGLLRPNLLAAHVNYLAPPDSALLAKAGVSVVHCPRSHCYFQHGPFPLRRLLRADVNVCLGTDSLATVYRKRGETVELDMFAEMRALSAREPWLSPRAILRMATVNAARALHQSGKIGELRPGARADVVVLPLNSGPSAPYEAVLRHEGPVLASMIDGRWALPPPP